VGENPYGKIENTFFIRDAEVCKIAPVHSSAVDGLSLANQVFGAGLTMD
jgi:hypothetical protein